MPNVHSNDQSYLSVLSMTQLTFHFSPKGLKTIQQVLVTAIICLLLLVIGYTHSIIELRILFFATLLWSCLAIFWIIRKQRSATPFKIPLLIWTGIYALCVAFSLDPRRSAGQMLIMSSIIFLFLFTYDLVAQGWPATIFIQGAFIASTIITLAGLFEFSNWYRHWIQINPGQWLPEITFRPAASNVMAPFNYFTAIFAVSYFFTQKKWLLKMLSFLAGSIALVMLFITSSRGGWLGAAAGLGLLVLLISIREKTRVKRFWTSLKSRPVVMAVLFLFLLAFMFLAGTILYKQAIHPTHGSIFTSRSLFWRIALDVFRNNPLFGQGPLTYGSAFLAGTSVPPDLVWVHAHNSYLNLLAEMGLAGLAGIIILAIPVLSALKQKLFSTLNDPQPIILPVIAFFTAYCVHTFFDSLHMEPAIPWTLAIVLGAALAYQKNGEKELPSIPSRANLWVILPVLAAWVGLWLVLPYHQGVQLANSNQWDAAQEKFTQATRRDPSFALAHQQLALVSSVLADQGKPGDLQTAIQHLRQAIELEPGWALNYANLASLLAATGDWEAAEHAAQEAVRISPRVSLFQMNLAQIAEHNQQTQLAQEAYLAALNLDSSLRDSEFWTATELRQSSLANWQKDHPIAPPVTLAEAQENLRNNPQSSWAYNQLASVQLGLGQVDDAQHLLDNAGLAYSGRASDRIETTWLLAETKALQGDQEAAQKLAAQALENYRAYGLYGPGSFGLLYYAPRMFRMPAMALEIVPQMEINYMFILHEPWFE